MELEVIGRDLGLLGAAVRRAEAAGGAADLPTGNAVDPADRRDPDLTPGEEALAALEALHRTRDLLTTWEPLLIGWARGAGVSWARLAPALGVTSRQAAERRYLRLCPSDGDQRTGEERVRAARDERAGDRAVSSWARDHASELRQIAGRVSAAPGLTGAGRRRARTLATSLTEDDPAMLIEPLTGMHGDLVAGHSDLAEEVSAVARKVTRVRSDTQRQRARREPQS